MEIDAEVTIKKRGAGPIEVKVTSGELGVHMGLAEFLSALAGQVGNPTMLFTVAGLEAKLQAAAGPVLAAMKQETKRL
jgi:hypothetical protein